MKNLSEYSTGQLLDEIEKRKNEQAKNVQEVLDNCVRHNVFFNLDFNSDYLNREFDHFILKIHNKSKGYSNDLVYKDFVEKVMHHLFTNGEVTRLMSFFEYVENFSHMVDYHEPDKNTK